MLKLRAKGFIGLFIAIIFFLVSLRAPGVNATALDYAVPPMIALIQQYSLPVIGLCIFLSICIWFITGGISNLKRPSTAIICFLVFHQILVFTEFYYNDDFQQLLLNLVFNFALFLFFGYVIKDWQFYNQSSSSFLHIIFWGIFSFILLNVILYFGGWGVMMWKGRFYGLTSQPNFIGMCGGVCGVLSLALIFEKKPIKIKIFFLLGILLGGLVCILSASRSSIVSGLAGASYIIISTFRNSSIRVILSFIVVCFVTYFLFFIDISSLDFTERGNTRDKTWQMLFNAVMDVPILGLGSKATATTNSYLYAIAAAGIIGSLFFYFSLFGILRQFNNLQSWLKMPGNRTAVYGYVGLGIFLCFGALFEGFLLDSASMPIFVYWSLLSYSR